MKLKKAEAYIDTVVTVFVNLIILYLVLNLFSYMITYQKLNHAADNIIRCAAINGTTDTGVIGENINEYITNEGFDRSKVTVSFDGSEYISSTENIQFGDTILLNIKTKQSFNFIGRTGSSIFDISVNKTNLSEKYYQNTNNNTIKPIAPDPATEIKRNGVIPEGGTYYTGGELCAYCSYCYGVSGVPHGPMTDSMYEFTNTPTATYSAGDNFPASPSVGDIYVEGDYIYDYFSSGWHVRAAEDKSVYGAIVSEIAGKPLTSMEYTFSGCTSLTTAPTIPSSVKNMNGTFGYCTSLTTAPAIPSSVTDMTNTFENCSSLTSAPDMSNASSVTDMSHTFYRCIKLTTAPTIPNGVTDMYGTFSGCTTLATAPVMPDSVINMQGTFSGCRSLTTAPVIPNSITNMKGTFSNCTSLTTAPVIPNNVTSMYSTFQGCTSLTTAPAIPSSVTDMWGTFYGCTSLTGTIEINANPTDYGECFKNTTKPITLTGSSTKLNELAATANNSNVIFAQ